MKFEQSIIINRDPADIYAVFKNVSDWSTWDPETESASLDGDFTVGTTGKIKPKGAPISKIVLTEITENQSITVESGLPLCKMHFVHLLNKVDDGTEVIMQLIFSGFLGPLFGRLIGNGINKALSGSLQGLKDHMES